VSAPSGADGLSGGPVGTFGPFFMGAFEPEASGLEGQRYILAKPRAPPTSIYYYHLKVYLTTAHSWELYDDLLAGQKIADGAPSGQDEDRFDQTEQSEDEQERPPIQDLADHLRDLLDEI